MLRRVCLRKFVVGCLMLLGGWTAAVQAEDVCIAQFVSHPALDAMVAGVEEILQQRPELKISRENAHGNMSIGTQIAQKILSQRPSVIVSLTTPLTQTFSQVFKGQNIPIVFGAVTDPVQARIVSEPATPVFGVIDQPDLAAQMALIKECLPNVLKVGVPYSPGEANSVAIVEQLKALPNLPFQFVWIPVARSGELVSALKSALADVQALYLPQDNAVISAIDVAIASAHAVGVPVFTSVTEVVEKGALAALGYDFKDMGRDVGKITLTLLEGGSDLRKTLEPVQRPSQTRLWLNRGTAEKLGVVLPDALLKRADRVVDNVNGA